MRLIRVTGLYEKLTKKRMLYVVFIYLVGSLLLSAAPAIYLYIRFGVANLSPQVWTLYANYQAPHVVLMAVALLIYFDRFVRCPVWLEKLAVCIAPSMFGVYLLHTSCVSFGRRFFQFPQEWLHDKTTVGPFLEIFLSGVICFVVCTLVDCARRKIFARPIGLLLALIKKLDMRIGLE